MGFRYYSPVTVQTGQVPSTQTNFPILVSVTDARFKTTGNGGNVSSSSGYDIRPYSDSALSTALTYELERYNATTGEVIMWIKIPSLSDGYVVYLAYGNSALTTDGSDGPNTFSNSFKSVYHFKDGTSLSLADSLNTYNGTGAGSPTAATGQIDGGLGLASASNQYVQVGDQRAAAMSVMCWVKATTFPAAYNTAWGEGLSDFTQNFRLLVNSSGKLACTVFATTQLSYDGTGSHTLSTGTWYHLAFTYDSSAGGVGYVNAASDKTFAANGAIKITNAVSTFIGRDVGATLYLWNGVIDELQVSTVARSANWITTTYNNQSAPGTFATLGTEVAIPQPQGWFFFFPH